MQPPIDLVLAGNAPCMSPFGLRSPVRQIKPHVRVFLGGIGRLCEKELLLPHRLHEKQPCVHVNHVCRIHISCIHRLLFARLASIGSHAYCQSSIRPRLGELARDAQHHHEHEHFRTIVIIAINAIIRQQQSQSTNRKGQSSHARSRLITCQFRLRTFPSIHFWHLSSHLWNGSSYNAVMRTLPLCLMDVLESIHSCCFDGLLTT